MEQNTVSIKLDRNQIENFRKIMESLGWIPKIIKSDYIDYAFTSPQGSVATLYSSGKLVLQGKKTLHQLLLTLKQVEEKVLLYNLILV
jgi:ribonuclease HIII